MKIVLLSTLSLFLLTGCDNFVLLKPVKDKATEFTFTHTDQGPGGKPPVIETKPQIPNKEGTPPATGKTQPAPEPIITPSLPPATGNESAKLPDAPAPAPAQAPATPPVAAAPKPAPVAPAAPAAPAPPASAPAQTRAEEPQMGPNTITVHEYANFQNMMELTLGAEKKYKLMKEALPNGVKSEDIKTQFSGHYTQFNLAVLNKEQVIAEFKNLKMSLVGEYKVKSNNGYELSALCMGAKCELLYVSVHKLDDSGKFVENYRTAFKIVNKEYVVAHFKSNDVYMIEYRAIKDPNAEIKLVPQNLVFTKLQEYITAYGDKVLMGLRSELEKSESVVYSDKVLGNQEALQVTFSRDAGKLLLNVQIHPGGPRNAISLKSEISADTVTAGIKSESGLSLQVLPIVKSKMFGLLFSQENFKSKIANAKTGIQAMVCSLVEEEGSQFSKCIPVGAAELFEKEGVVEGNLKEQLNN